MLSKRTLELAIEQIENAVYRHSQIPHDPMYKDFLIAYAELHLEMGNFKADNTCKIIAETETTNMRE